MRRRPCSPMGVLFLAIVLMTVVAGRVHGDSVAGGPQAEPPAMAKHENTNVILVSLQCLRPDHLGMYGYQRETSPNIDALARESVIFENAISQAALTPVAQMSVFTSQYPRVNGMVSFEIPKDAVSQLTLPVILKNYGYVTAAFSSAPEFFLRYETESGTTVNPGDVFFRAFDFFGFTKRWPPGRNLRQIPAETLQWLRDNKDRKFFLWIASGLLHMPYSAFVPQSQRDMYDPQGYIPFWKRIPQIPEGVFTNDDPSYEIFSRVHHNTFYWDFTPVYRLTEEDIRYVSARYDAGVQSTDRFIGELRQLLDSLQLSGKTLLLLQSVHGDDLGEQGKYFHYDVSEAVVKNALTITFPGGEFGNRRVSEQVQSIDIMPTVLAYLGIPAPHEAQGGSLMPLIKGEHTRPPCEFAFIDRLPWWEYTLSKWYLEFQGIQGTKFSAGEKERLKEYLKLLQTSFDALGYPPGDIAIRTNEWKLIVRKNLELLNKISWWSFITGRNQDAPELELYDLKKDPLEQNNVAGEHPEVVAWLKGKLVEWDSSMERQKTGYKKDDKRYIIPYP